MKHYKNLMSALGDAMPMCLAWRLVGTENNYFNARDLFAFALADDEADGALKEGQFYLVSAEGAIGIASGYEYLVKWLFIPFANSAIDLGHSESGKVFLTQVLRQGASSLRKMPRYLTFGEGNTTVLLTSMATKSCFSAGTSAQKYHGLTPILRLMS